MRRVALFAVCALLAGCASSPSLYAVPSPESVARFRPLSRIDVLTVVHHARSSEDAIQSLEARRFAFALDDKSLYWFREWRVDPDVLVYLEQRAAYEGRVRYVERAPVFLGDDPLAWPAPNKSDDMAGWQRPDLPTVHLKQDGEAPLPREVDPGYEPRPKDEDADDGKTER
jgi:hypothetical protein